MNKEMRKEIVGKFIKSYINADEIVVHFIGK